MVAEIVSDARAVVCHRDRWRLLLFGLRAAAWKVAAYRATVRLLLKAIGRWIKPPGSFAISMGLRWNRPAGRTSMLNRLRHLHAHSDRRHAPAVRESVSAWSPRS